MSKKFFVTTPIYYSNWVPHIWHSYSSLLADILARYKRFLWYDVKFSTWVDENSQKVVLKAQEEWIDIISYVDKMAKEHKKVWDWLRISYTDFIRTTERKHKDFVQKILQKTYDAGDIYKWEYKWLYCVWCEAFKKKTDLTKDWLCPDHLKKPDEISEQNWFFRLSKYQEQLENLYQSDRSVESNSQGNLESSDSVVTQKDLDNTKEFGIEQGFVFPWNRFNEVKAFVTQWLDDFSISRETNKFGIPLPFDDKQVTYVWYDALLNYLTVCQWWQEEFAENWNMIHVVGKDIIRFHAIYWPAMMLAAWIELKNLPRQVVCTWYLTINWQKISKSLGNVIDPVELMTNYSRDALNLYLFSDLNIGNDWDFNVEKFHGMYDSILVWGWWNLVRRVVKPAEKNGVSRWVCHEEFLEELRDIVTNKDSRMEYEGYSDWSDDYDYNGLINFFWVWLQDSVIENYLNSFNMSQYLKDWKWLVDLANKFIQVHEPWVKLKNESDSIKQQWIKELEFSLYMIKNIWLLSAPFFIDWFEKLQKVLWNEQLNEINLWVDKDAGNVKSYKWLQEGKFKELFDMKSFAVNLNSWTLLYQKVDK